MAFLKDMTSGEDRRIQDGMTGACEAVEDASKSSDVRILRRRMERAVTSCVPTLLLPGGRGNAACSNNTAAMTTRQT